MSKDNKNNVQEEDVDVSNLAAYSSDEEDPAETPSKAPSKTDAEIKKDDTYSTMYSSGFRDFLLKPALLRAIVDCGFEHPSEVQNRCIPQAILGTDVICQARSGMGKTAVFVLSVLQQLEDNPEGVRCLVLCHARELAYQICNDFDRFKKYMPNVKTGVFYGGIKIQANIQLLREDKPNIVIGTPGRILALINNRELDLSKLKFFVLDECDKMLESLDMRKDVQQIFRATPRDKQVMMFSATLSEEIRPVCKKFMHDVKCRVDF